MPVEGALDMPWHLQKPCIKFLAGLMFLDGGLMKPDNRKGLLCLYEDDNEILHLQWYERHATGRLDLQQDHAMAKGSAHFYKVPRPGARIFHLKHEQDEALFFWCQDPKDEHDGILVTAMDRALQGQLHVAVAQLPDALRALPGAPAPSNAGLQSINADIQQQVNPDLQSAATMAARLLSSMASSVPGMAPVEAAHPSLADVMTTDALRTLLDDDDIVARLAEFLPEQQRTPHDVRAVVACPQFKHQLHVLSMALKTGQLDFAQFGLPPEAQGASALAFLRAIQESVDRAKGPSAQ